MQRWRRRGIWQKVWKMTSQQIDLEILKFYLPKARSEKAKCPPSADRF